MARTGKPVLIVEDDPALRQTIGQILEEEGYRVQMAANGQEALNALDGGEDPCVILLDLMMPVMNGWQFLERRNRDERLGSLPVVSAYLDPPLPGAPAFAAPHLKVEGVLKKPIDLQDLVTAVARRCQEGDAGR